MSDQKSSRGQRTREQLLEIAFRQFTSNGFHGTSMRTIAEEAGVAPSGIYNHYPSKDELLKAVVIAYHPLTVIAKEMSITEDGDFEEFLREMARRAYQHFLRQPDILKLFMIELTECEGRHLPELLTLILPTVQSLAPPLLGRENRFRLQSPLAVIRIFIGSMFGFLITEVVLGHVTNKPAGDLGSFEQFLDVIFYGLKHDDLQ